MLVDFDVDGEKSDLDIVDDDGDEVSHLVASDTSLKVRRCILICHLIHHELKYRFLSSQENFCPFWIFIRGKNKR